MTDFEGLNIDELKDWDSETKALEEAFLRGKDQKSKEILKKMKTIKKEMSEIPDDDYNLGMNTFYNRIKNEIFYKSDNYE